MNTQPITFAGEPVLKSIATAILEKPNNNIKLQSCIASHMNSIISALQETTSPQSLSQTISKASSLSSTSKDFVLDFVARYLHPYITGQIIRENESPNRKAMLLSLLEKMPELETSQIPEIVVEAFQAYINKAALGLYVNRKEKYKIMEDTSSLPFGILVCALEEALPKDFGGIEISKSELVLLAQEALVHVNKEKTLLDREAKRSQRPGNANIRYVKLMKLRKSSLLFLSLPSKSSEKKEEVRNTEDMMYFDLKKKIDEAVKPLEKELVSLMATSSLDLITDFEKKITCMESKSLAWASFEIYINQLQGIFEMRLGVCKSIVPIVKKLIEFDKTQYGDLMDKTIFIRQELTRYYVEFLHPNTKILNYTAYIGNILNRLGLIEKIHLMKNKLTPSGNDSDNIHAQILKFEEKQWNDLMHANPHDNPEDIQSKIQSDYEKLYSFVYTS